MTSKDIVIFDRASGVPVILTEMIRQCNPKTHVFTSNDLETAQRMVLEHRPRLLITEAIPVLDVQNPNGFQTFDPGFQLIKSTRENPDDDISTAWIMVLMSRPKEYFPDQVRELLGERASIFEKPPDFADVQIVLEHFTQD